jgi:hypothetical protein
MDRSWGIIEELVRDSGQQEGRESTKIEAREIAALNRGSRGGVAGAGLSTTSDEIIGVTPGRPGDTGDAD